MSAAELTDRLLACASFVGEGEVFADIGTDHAYLAIHLLSIGKISHAYLTDIEKRPLERARCNVAAAGLSDRVDFYLTDGAAALSELGITTYAICGMGGELIADIISRAPALHRPGVTLILQPMTRAEDLRRYLFNNGFSVAEEKYAADLDKSFIILKVHYTGVVRDADEEELYFGNIAAADFSLPQTRAYFKKIINRLSAIQKGKQKGKENTEREERLLRYAEANIRFE